MSASLFSTLAFSSDCPDFSGHYQMDLTSCSGKGYKDSKGWPLPTKISSVVEVNQKNCEEIQISYLDPAYTSPVKQTVKIDIHKARKVVVDDENGLYLNFFEPKERVTYFGHTLSASETSKIYFRQSSDELIIKSSILTRGFYDYIIPVLDNDQFECHLKKI
jgi:hypothetical protein